MERDELISRVEAARMEALRLADKQHHALRDSLEISFSGLHVAVTAAAKAGPVWPKEEMPSFPSPEAGHIGPLELQSLGQVRPSLKPRALEEDFGPALQPKDPNEPKAECPYELVHVESESMGDGNLLVSSELSVSETIPASDDDNNASQASPRMGAASPSASWFGSSSPGMGKKPALLASLTAEANQSKSGILEHNPLPLYLDYTAGFFVSLNFIFMCVELELEGGTLDPIDPVEDNHGVIFGHVQLCFAMIYLLELLLRIYAEKRDFMYDWGNWFDMFLVTASLGDVYLFVTVGGQPGTTQMQQVLRALSTLRTLRVLRIFRLFSGLRLLLKACHAFLPTLAWSMVLLGMVMAMSGLMLGKLLQHFLEAEANLEDRIWVWQHYGTAYRSIYTLYEITFAGNWPANVRPVLEKVSHLFVIFFVLYITIIVFAAIRVITAVFLKDTLDAAHNDAEHQLAEGIRKKAQYVQKLESIFEAIDETGNGMITEERLNQILENPRVKAYFETLDLAVHEGTALFHILDNGDGEVTLEEFIDGILRCKGPARAIDQVAMHADLKKLEEKLMQLADNLNSKKASDESKETSKKRRKDRMRSITNDLKVFRFLA
ncbi:unnamed protein product [Effrenium voratum]|nr:unnamed protein product [Effrenium voratum]